MSIVEFYKEYCDVIVYHCKNGKASLRAPVKMASTLYIKDAEEKINKYKSQTLDIAGQEENTRFLGTFFSYYKYDRFYKIFDGSEFLNAEKRYPFMWMLDVTRCFESIYTHTISWAVKTKEFAKKHKRNKSFGCDFDDLMEDCNDRETNGIIIGPEISRIFSEVILQDVDKKAILELAKKELIYGKQYVFYRYVDDFIIFPVTEDVAGQVAAEITEQLSKYNLHVNDRKVQKFSRPFFTDKSHIARLVIEKHEVFISQISDRVGKFLKPKKIRRKIEDLKLDFINSIKSSFYKNDSALGVASTILVSYLSKRIVLLVEGFDVLNTDEIVEGDYRNCFLLIFETMFYFYSICPTVNSSYHLSKSIVLTTRFFEKEFPYSADYLKSFIAEQSKQFLEVHLVNDAKGNKSLIPLEKINVLLALTELGEEHLLSKKFLESLFDVNSSSFNYFEIMTYLFYIKDYSEYSEIKTRIVQKIDEKLGDLKDVDRKSEKAYIFLDSISCPYLDMAFRKRILEKFYGDIDFRNFTNNDLEKTIAEAEQNYWFIDWKNIDLLNVLQKKRLQPTY